MTADVAAAADPAAIPCPDLETLEALASGLLSGASGAGAATHAARCAACQSLLAEIATNLGTLADLRSTNHDHDVKALADVLDDTFEGYEAVREIHRGGQGVVIEARQVSTGRRVAIKLMRDPRGPGLRERIRFDREVEVAARLQHPGIVTVFDRGETRRGRRYFVMELVDGEPLDVHIARVRPALDDRLDLFEELCGAVHAAHQRGVLHRDLKPGNVMVGRDGRVRVLDFGLALAIGGDGTASADPSRVTMTGEFMGTLAYASPEQVAGDPDRVDLRTDVYALGVMLYWLVTDAHPYSVDGPIAEIIGNINSAPPRSINRLRPEADQDLDLIVRTSLEKDPDLRYGSVAALADDLRRQRTGLPISARTPSVRYQIRKFARRNRALVGALLFALAALLFGTGAAGIGLVDARRSAAIADDRARSAQRAETRTELARLRERDQRELAERRERDAEFRAYCAAIAAAQGALAADDVRGARRRLDQTPPSLRDWEWAFLDAQLDGSLAAPPAHDDWTWDAVSLPDGRFVTVGADGRVILRDAAGEPIDAVTATSSRLYALAAAPDGGRVAAAAGDGEVIVLRVEAESIAVTARVRAHGSLAQAVAWSPCGGFYASAGWDSTVAIVDAATDTVIERIAHPERVWWIAFAPDGPRVATLARDNVVRIWIRRPNRGPHGGSATLAHAWRLHEPGDWSGSIHQIRLAWSPRAMTSGSLIAAGQHDGPIRLYDPDDGSLRATLLGHRRRVRNLAFSRDGRTLASTSDDATVRLWDLERLEERTTLRGHDTEVFAVAWCPSGARLLTGGKDPTLRLWPSVGAAGPMILDGHRGQSIHALAFAPARNWLLSGGAFADPSIRIRDAESGAPVAILDGHTSGVSGLIAIAGGAGLFSAGWDGRLIRWDTVDLRPIGEDSLETPVQAVCALPDGRHAAAVGRNGVVVLVDMDVPRVDRVIRAPGDRADAIAVNPTSDTVLVGTDAGTVEEWSVGLVPRPATGDAHRAHLHRAGAPRRQWTIGTSRVLATGVTDDGRFAFAGDRDGAVVIWPLDHDGPMIRTAGHIGSITTAISLSPRRILTLGTDRTARIWDVESGQAVLSWLADDDWPVSVAIEPASRTLATAGRSVRVWPTAPPTARAVIERARQARANRLTAELLATHDLWSAVRRVLEEETGSSEEVRDAALAIAALGRDEPTTLVLRALTLVATDGDETDPTRARRLAARALEVLHPHEFDAEHTDTVTVAAARAALALALVRAGDPAAAAESLRHLHGERPDRRTSSTIESAALAVALCASNDHAGARSLFESRGAVPHADRAYAGLIELLWRQVEACLVDAAPSD